MVDSTTETDQSIGALADLVFVRVLRFGNARATCKSTHSNVIVAINSLIVLMKSPRGVSSRRDEIFIEAYELSTPRSVRSATDSLHNSPVEIELLEKLSGWEGWFTPALLFQQSDTLKGGGKPPFPT